MTRALDRGRDRSLMRRAGTRDPSGKNLSSLGDILPQRGDILEIHGLRLITAKHTDLSSAPESAGSSRPRGAASI